MVSLTHGLDLPRIIRILKKKFRGKRSTAAPVPVPQPEPHQLVKHVQNGFVKAGLEPPQVGLVWSEEPFSAADILIRRNGAGFDLHFHRQTPVHYQPQLFDKAAGFMHWLSHASPDVTEILADCTDGEGPSNARYAYSVNRAGVTALPDMHFLIHRGYADIDAHARAHPVAWADRHDRIVWRGALNNMGHFNLDPAFKSHPGVMQRLRMAQQCRGTQIDFRFVEMPYNIYNTVLQKAGLIGEFIPATDWGSAKFAVDIDGFTNAWSNFIQRLKLGCCILKVDSQFGFTQWYYDQIRPWEHYVPIKADLSDLHQQIDWVRSNDAQAAEIAANGQRFASQLTMDSETRVAARLINQTEGVA